MSAFHATCQNTNKKKIRQQSPTLVYILGETGVTFITNAIATQYQLAETINMLPIIFQ